MDCAKGATCMELNCTQDLAEMRPAIRRFVKERMEPLARSIDATWVIPESVTAEMHDQGYL